MDAAASNILLIDSSTEESRLTALVLADALPGCSITTVRNALEFAEAFAEEPPALVIADSRVDWTDSAKLVQLLTKRWKAPLLVFGCSERGEETGGLLDAGAAEVLPKSVAAYSAILTRTVCRLLQPKEDPPAGGTSSPAITPFPEEAGVYRNFAHLVAHEARRPAERIRRAARLISMEYGEKLSADALELLDHLESGAQDLSEVLDGLLALGELSRTPPPEEAAVNLDELVDEVIAGAQPGHNGRRARIGRRALPSVRGNPRFLELLFRNLIENGLKYNCSEQPEIIVSAREDDGHWLVSVADNGIGIPETERERVLQPFHRLHAAEEFPGTGLGLALCQRVAEYHNTALHIAPNEPAGTVVSIRLPGA